MQTVTLSKSAHAVLRLCAKGLRLPVTDRRPEAYRELADAGIMQPDGDDFRLTEDGWARREELISAPEAHLRSLEPRLPDCGVGPCENGSREALVRQESGAPGSTHPPLVAGVPLYSLIARS